MVTSISESTRLWEKALKKIEAKLGDKATFDSFFLNTYIHDIKGNVIYVVTPSNVSKTVLSGQYFPLIKSVVNDLTEEEYVIKFINKSEVKDQVGTIKVTKGDDEEIKPSKYFEYAKLNKELTFDNFIVGEFNKEAHQAALYVAKNGGTLFNPLFIYSQPALGKTHLLHAIGNEIIASRIPNAKILYITANDFVEEYIKFVRAEKDSQQLKDFFKDVDVLLFDDVQFLANKVRTEEMFFYVYQDLIARGKRIIITSDRQPSELKGLEERLVSRFSQGLTVTIGEPDKQTSVEILRRKIKESSLDESMIDEDVINLFAEKFSKNVRELEGALNRLIFYSLNLKPTDRITLEVAIEAIGSLKGSISVANQISETKIINTVANYYNISPADITGNSRTGQIALARHISMYLIRKNLDVPLKKIGDSFGGKDHTTVMSGISKVDKELKTNEQLRRAIDELEALLKE